MDGLDVVDLYSVRQRNAALERAVTGLDSKVVGPLLPLIKLALAAHTQDSVDNADVHILLRVDPGQINPYHQIVAPAEQVDRRCPAAPSLRRFALPLGALPAEYGAHQGVHLTLQIRQRRPRGQPRLSQNCHFHHLHS